MLTKYAEKIYCESFSRLGRNQEKLRLFRNEITEHPLTKRTLELNGAILNKKKRNKVSENLSMNHECINS